MDTGIDIEQWRLPAGTIPSVVVSRVEPARKHYARYISAPLSFDWITAAAHLPGRALHVAMALRYLVGLKKCNTVALTHKTLREFGIGVSTSRRMLASMEEAGLIAVERHCGKAPRVTVLEK